MTPAWLLILGLILPSWVFAESLVDTQIIADSRLEKSKLNDLEKYLQRYIGKKAKRSSALAAENFLSRLYFVSFAQCEMNKNKLICKVIPKLRISNINIRNLPASLLESELVRKLPIQRGQLIIFDQSIGTNLIDLTRSRIKTFLRKVGYYGAQIYVGYSESKEDLAISFNIRIEGGAFAEVNNVIVDGNPPIETEKIQKIYRRMCLSFNRLFDALSLWSFACYSRELEREATDDLQERLARLGYVRARIRVQHEWLDPHAASTPRHCLKKDVLDTESRCVDLRIEIDRGPKVTWSINILDGASASRNGFTRFMGSLFAVDHFSRSTLSDDSNELPSDQVIIKQELEKQINFVDAKNIDEQELKVSEENMTKYLVSKGYANAEVVASYVQQDVDNILVTFDVYPGRTYYIRSVKIEPSMYAGYISEEELHNLVKQRSFFASGHLSYPEIDFAKSELIKFINDKGFSNVEAIVDMTAVGAGAVDIIFHISSKAREIIDEIVIINGVEDLNNQVISILKNCDNYNIKNKSCQNSSFLPEQITSDELIISDFYELNEYVYVKVKNQVIHENNKNKLIFFLYDKRFPDDQNKKLVKQNIKDMIISGNAHTNENVIRRLFPQAKNSPGLDFLSLRKGIANLRESGRFSRIDQKLMAAQENSDSLYFALQVIERPSLSLDFSLGFSTDQLLSLEAELEENNLFSSMLSIKTKLAIGLFWGRQSSINNKFIWPFIWGKPFIFTLHAPIIVYDDKSHLEKKPYRRLQSKIVASLDWRASLHFSPSIRYSLAHTKKDEPPTPLSLREKFRTLDGLITTIKKPGKFSGMLKPGVSYVNLDNPFDPRSGVNLYNWIEISAGPFAGITPFVNLGTENRFYIPMGACTLALQATFMRTFMTPSEANFEELKDISSMDKLGGDRSVRGYAEKVIGMTSTTAPIGSYSGYFANIANVEFRFPLTQSGTWGNFSGALFVDQGMVIPCEGLFKCASNKSFRDLVKENAFGLSVGAGLRYKLPVGPLSLDYGISPIRAKTSRIHFQFGYAF